MSLNVSACLFTRRKYAAPEMEAARATHNCRYFEPAAMARLCRILAQPAADASRSEREFEWRHNFEWWCAALWDSPEWRGASRPTPAVAAGRTGS